MSNTDPLLITDSDMAGVLKNVYTKFRVNSFPIATVLLAQVAKGSPGGPESMQWGGNGVYWDVRLGRPVNMVASQAGYFGQPSQVREKQATLGIKRTYVTRHIDQLAAVGTESKEAAFVPLARKIVEEALDAAKLGQQEILHGNGLGIKAVVTTASSTTSLICQKPYGVTGAGQGGLLLDVDMYVDVLSSNGVTSRGKSFITAVSNSGDSCTVTLGTALDGAQQATDIIVAATASDNSYNAYPNGLINITNRAAGYQNFEGINAATAGNERWTSTALVAGTDTPDAGQPSEMDIWTLIRKVAGVSGKDAQASPGEFLLLTTPGVAKALGESFLGQRRFDMGQKTLKGGFGAMEICGLPLVTDTFCPAGTVYLVHVPSLTWVDALDWQKIQFEGAGPWRFISGRDAYEVTFGSYWNFGGLQRITHGAITGYTDTARFSHVI